MNFLDLTLFDRYVLNIGYQKALRRLLSNGKLGLSMVNYDMRLLLGPASPLPVPFESLMKSNTDRLLEVRTEYPEPAFHQRLLKRILDLPEENIKNADTLQLYVDGILQADNSNRVIYIDDAFFADEETPFLDDDIYPSMEVKSRPLELLTSQSKVYLFVCLQPFSDLVGSTLSAQPELQKQLATDKRSLSFSWLPFIERLKATWPNAKITIFKGDELAPHWAAYVALMTAHRQAHTFKNISKYPLSRISDQGRRKLRFALHRDDLSICDWITAATDIFAEYGHKQDSDSSTLWSPEQHDQLEKLFEQDIQKLGLLDNVLLGCTLIKKFF